MKKYLVIEIGGTGLSAIRELRGLIAERYEQGSGSPDVASIKTECEGKKAPEGKNCGSSVSVMQCTGL